MYHTEIFAYDQYLKSAGMPKRIKEMKDKIQNHD